VKRFKWLGLLIIILSGCSLKSPVVQPEFFRQHEQTPEVDVTALNLDLVSDYMDFDQWQKVQNLKHSKAGFSGPLLSPGDRIRLLVRQGEIFAGVYELDAHGQIKLSYMDALELNGLSVPQAVDLIKRTLEHENMFKPGQARVSLSVAYWAPVKVSVAGSVFNNGEVAVQGRTPEERALYQNVSAGDSAPYRTVAAAIRAAGGVRPDADIRRILVFRKGQVRMLNLSGLLTGSPADDIDLAAGDQIVVPTTARFDASLAKPSPLTPPGIRIYLSNLTVPADSNAESVNDESMSSLPYGSHFSHALFSANCIGGTAPVNASRSAILVGHDPLAGTMRYLQLPVEQVIRNPANEALNPVLLPGDAVGCYDSAVTNMRDIARTATDLLTPLNILRSIEQGMFGR